MRMQVPPNGYHHSAVAEAPAFTEPFGERFKASMHAPINPEHLVPHKRPSSLSDAGLGQEIRARRRGLGWTQKELAGMIGVTGAQLHRYETGTTPMAHNRVIALAAALGVSSATLSEAREQPPQEPAMPHPDAGDELLALVEVFSRITDAKNRSAVVAIARILATASPSDRGT